MELFLLVLDSPGLLGLSYLGSEAGNQFGDTFVDLFVESQPALLILVGDGGVLEVEQRVGEVRHLDVLSGEDFLVKLHHELHVAVLLFFSLAVHVEAFVSEVSLVVTDSDVLLELLGDSRAQA